VSRGGQRQPGECDPPQAEREVEHLSLFAVCFSGLVVLI